MQGKEAGRNPTNVAQLKSTEPKSLSKLKSLTERKSLTQPEPLTQLKPLTQLPRSILVKELDRKRRSSASLAARAGHGRKVNNACFYRCHSREIK